VSNEKPPIEDVILQWSLDHGQRFKETRFDDLVELFEKLKAYGYTNDDIYLKHKTAIIEETFAEHARITQQKKERWLRCVKKDIEKARIQAFGLKDPDGKFTKAVKKGQETQPQPVAVREILVPTDHEDLAIVEHDDTMAKLFGWEP
jgi:hypothetical protein